MESPPSFSTHSEAPLLSEDSGLLITSGSFSSDSASGWPQITSELQESDCDERSLSLYDSADTSERMCGDNFNTVKKGPGKALVTPIEPPPEFQDSPILIRHEDDESPKEDFQSEFILEVETLSPEKSLRNLTPVYVHRTEHKCGRRQCLNQRFASPRLLHLSPCHSTRPASRNSLTSRLSSSHNSLTTQIQADDSSFITQAISHDTLSTTANIADMYNVPFDSDIYAVPIDMIRPVPISRHKGKKNQKTHRKRVRSICQTAPSSSSTDRQHRIARPCVRILEPNCEGESKRHSIPGPSLIKNIAGSDPEPMHMTLHDVRKYLHTLYSSSSESETKVNMPVHKHEIYKQNGMSNTNAKVANETVEPACKSIENNNNLKKLKKNTFSVNVKEKKYKEIRSAKEIIIDSIKRSDIPKQSKHKSSPVKNLSINIKQTFCNLFRLRRSTSSEACENEELSSRLANIAPPIPVLRRALPPLPQTPQASPKKQGVEEDGVIDFATSIQKVKDYGWYWGPISVEAAEKILSNEPDGSFIVRDSSDDHYIFTLTFKLNGMRHVRIEHEQGNFCFGGCTMFKAHTIVEFIENAVETSRSGRYLFFLNLRPVLGPVRVQLLYPVSRFKRVQSLQHMCRFVILKVVRRDLVNNLPLPRRLLDYLSATHYYSELLTDT